MSRFYLKVPVISLLSLLGLQAYSSSLFASALLSPLTIQQNQDTVRREIKQVVVEGVTENKEIESSPFPVKSISLRQAYASSGDVGDFLNRVSGVKLRSDGSVGSQVQVNLAGLQGKAVRMFKDGVPIELFGHGFNLGTIPVNMLNRVDVYKGALPVYLASDALGGAINFVSRQEYKKVVELSYEVGSFNTHRATANILWQDKQERWYAGTNSSFNYAKNNYKVNAPFLDSETNVREYRNVPRFHDDARSHYVEAFVGLKNRQFADDMRLTLIQSSFFKEIQHDAEMNKVYGEPFAKENNFSAILQYKKKLFQDRLHVDVLSAFSQFDTRFVDTATVRYGWDGHIIGSGLSSGEINRGNLQELDFRFYSLRILGGYRLSDKHRIDASYNFQRQHRVGSDPLGAVSAVENIDVMTIPARYSKNNSAIGLHSNWLGKDLESVVAVKLNSYRTRGYTTDNTGLGWQAGGQDEQLGYMAGLFWRRDALSVKSSYEYANRLPDEYEIFGDGRMTRENLALKPEKSHNINLNLVYHKPMVDFEVGLFHRRVRDIIFLQLDIPFSRYINYEKSKVSGIEVEAKYRPFHWLDVGGNVTYQDIRRVDIEEPMFRNMEGSRIPNVPFLFGNFWFNLPVANVFRKDDILSFSWNTGYMHRFFLYAIPKSQEPGLFDRTFQVSTSMLIPGDDRLGQMTHDATLTYRFARNGLAISASCRNLGDTRLYDNFSVQKPGRSFQLKMVYNLAY